MSASALVQGLARNKKHINPYGYDPHTYVCAIFVALFSISTILHLGQALWKRKWYLIPSLVVGGIGEILGWSGRLWSSRNVLNVTPFLIQISTTIIAPTFLAAANFIILGTIIKRTGPQYSRLPPNWYALIFITVDVIALVIQAIGGGVASAATQKDDGDPNKGGHIMLLGIIIQLVEIGIYVILAAGFFWNYSRRHAVRNPTPSKKAHPEDTAVNTPTGETHNGHLNGASLEKGVAAGVGAQGVDGRMTRNMRLMSYGLAFSTLCLLVRAIYRTAELGDGWGGVIIHTQVLFNVLDGAMIVLSMYTLNFLHPGFLL